MVGFGNVNTMVVEWVPEMRYEIINIATLIVALIVFKLVRERRL